MIVINYYGGPSAGKSLMSMDTTAALKRRGIRAELIPEAAKLPAFRQDRAYLSDQISLFAAQNNWLVMCERGGVAVAVVDSPLLLSILYRPAAYYDGFDHLVRSVNASYTNHDYILKRSTDIAYEPVGRVHSESEALDLDGQIRALLAADGIRHREIDTSLRSVDLVVSRVEEALAIETPTARATRAHAPTPLKNGSDYGRAGARP